MITICGYDIRKPGSFSNIHQMIGLCPQHDILFDVLSPYEHLEFFARIRGVSSSSLEEVIIRTLKDIDLEESANVFCKYLSGGQRRKLSVGIAIIGDPKIIILDEPTAGVDIVSKRHLWTVLQNKKHDKVILLSTHFMDEADILADRKAVISKGRVRCCGTSLFLKNKFGVGYHLTLVMRDTLPDKTSDIVNLVCEFVPKAKYSRKIAHDLSFILPLNSVDNFPLLFTTIEEEIKTQSRGLNIISYGVSMTTLGEVFFRLEKNEEDLSEVNDFPQATQKHSTYLPLILESNYDDKGKSMQDFQTGDHEDSEIMVDNAVELRSDDIIKKPFYIFFAMLKLRMLCLMRDFKTFINIVIITLIFCFIGILIMGHEMIAPSMKPLPLNIGTFEVAIAMHNETSHSVARLSSHISNDMKVEWYNGSFASLLNKSSLNLIAAVNITNCCHPSNLSFSIVYNDTQIHSLPTVINTINNAVYRMMLDNASMTQNRTFTLSTHPFQKISSSGNFNYLAFIGSFWLGMGLVIASATIVIDAIIDRETKSKNQLRVNGLSFLGYYGPYILIFTGIMIILCFGLLCLLYLFKFECLKETSALIPLLGTVFLFCISSVTFTTCVSFVFNKAETAQTHMANMIIFLGLIPFAITTALYSVNSDSMAPYIAHLIFSVLNPMYVPYSLFYFIFKVPSACRLNLALSCSSQYLNKEVITLVVGTLLQIPIYLSVLFILDYGKAGGSFTDFVHQIFRIKSNMKRKTSVSSNAIPSENCDLKAEQEKVDSFIHGSIPPLSNYPVIVVQV
uniref:Uncharacterized protein n=2 Tax=Clastoptera arizonana TaxID=38151 RepID=A0A1B6D564_9HEMI